MELLSGQVAVVTGAGSGLGLALAERFASAGLSVVVADVQGDALAAFEQTPGMPPRDQIVAEVMAAPGL